MSYSFWEAIAETPWWFYLIIFSTFYTAYLATKLRALPFKPLIASNLTYLITVIAIIIYFMPFNTFNLIFLFITMAVGTLLGWLQYQTTHIEIQKSNSQIIFPGSWTLFILITLFSIILPIAFFYFNFSIDFIVTIFSKNKFELLSGLGGFIIGLTFGRTYYLLHSINMSRHALR